jgi:hypothetical protein
MEYGIAGRPEPASVCRDQVFLKIDWLPEHLCEQVLLDVYSEGPAADAQWPLACGGVLAVLADYVRVGQVPRGIKALWSWSFTNRQGGSGALRAGIAPGVAGLSVWWPCRIRFWSLWLR